MIFSVICSAILQWQGENSSAKQQKNDPTSLKPGLSQTLSSLQWPDGTWCSGHTKVAPRGPPILPPAPFLAPELGIWLGKRTRSLPLACCGGHLPLQTTPSHRPLPSCSGQCPNASMSHLGLAKPVPTVRGQAWHAAVRALTPDGNTMAQGLSGWLG